MAIVGSAQVKIVADTTGFRPKVRAELTALRGPISAIGNDLGDRFAKSFNKSSTKTLGDTAAFRDMGRKAAQAFNQGMEQELSRGGQRGGRAYTSGFDREARSGIANSTAESVRNSERNGNAAARRAGTSIGSAMVSAFSKTMDSGFARSAKSAADSFTVFYAKSGAIYGIVSTLAGALSSLASGLYLVGTAAVSAASSVAALGGVLGAALQGGIAVGIAFKGVFSTLSQGFKASQEAAKASGDAGVANANRIADAQRNLDRIRLQNQERIATAVQKVKDAEVDLTRALREEDFAQRALTRARKEAREELEQLGFDAEDAALAQERAALTLEQAHAEMIAAQSLPVDDRSRREAELSYKEAELNYRVSKDRVQDLEREQRRAARTGIEGTRAYTSAQNDVNSATEKVAEAERALAEARQDEAKARRDAAQAEADAQRQLARALAETSSAANSAASAASAFDEAMKKLSPSAQNFVRGLLGMKDRFNEFKQAVQEPFFAQFNKSFFSAVNTLLPVFEKGLAATSDTMGRLAAQFSTGLTRNAGLLAETMQQNNEVLKIFTREGENGRSMMDDLSTVLLRVWTALGPLTKRFARFIRSLLDTAEAATDTKKELKGIENFFDRAGDRAARFGDMFKSIFNTFKNLAEAAEPAIDDLLQYFQDAFKQMDIVSGNSMEENRKFFKGVVDNLKPMLDFLGKITLEFFKLGDNKAIGDTFKRLQDAVPYLGQIFENGAALGPVLADIAVNFARLIAALTQGEGEGKGVLNYMFEMANWLVDKLADIAENPVFQAIFSAAAKPLAIMKAISLLVIGMRLAGQVLFGYMFKGAGVIRGAARFFQGAITTKSLRGGIASFKDGSDKDVTRGDIRISSAVDRTKLAVDASANRIVAAIRTLRIGGTGAPVYAPGTKTPKVTTNTKPGVKPSATKVGPMLNFPTGKAADDATKSAGKMSKAFGGLGKAFRFLGGPLGIVLMLLPALIGPLTEMWQKNEKLRDAVGKLFKIFEQVSGLIDTALRPVFEELLAAIVPVVIEIADELAPVFDEAMVIFQEEVMPTIKEIADLLVVILVPAIKIVAKIMTWWIKAQITLWKTLIPIIMPIVRFLVKALAVILVGAIKMVIYTFKQMWRIIKNLWETVGRPVFNLMKTVFKRVAEDLREKINAIKGFFTGLWTRIKTVIDDRIKPKFDNFVEAVKTLKDNVKRPIDAIKGFFAGIAEKIGESLKAIPGVVNDYIIKPINAVLDFLGLKKIPSLGGIGLGATTSTKAKRRAHGGLVGGDGGPTSDDQPHYLSTGEYVVRAASVRKYGRSTFDALNHGTARGGAVMDWIGDKFNSVKSLASNGAGAAIKKIVSEGLSSILSASGVGGFIKNIITGIINKIGSGAVSFGRKQEARAAAAAAGTGSFVPYRGPNGGWWYPVADRTPSSYSGHKGNWGTGSADFGMPSGAPVYAVSSGRVSMAGYSGWAGNTIVISHARRQSQYAHLSRLLVSRGDIVRTGEKIGLVGSTGNSSGPHLHFDMSDQPGGWLGVWELLKRLIASSPKKLAKGGVVPATPGGILSLIGEGGRAERVEPLDAQGLSVRDRAIIEQLANQQGAGGGNTVVRVYIGDRELRDIVDYEVIRRENDVARKVSGGRRTR